MLYGTIAAYNVSTPTASHWGGSVNTLWGHTYYIGLTAVILNLAVSAVLTLVLRATRVPAGADETSQPQYSADPVDTPPPAPALPSCAATCPPGTYRERGGQLAVGLCRRRADSSTADIDSAREKSGLARMSASSRRMRSSLLRSSSGSAASRNACRSLARSSSFRTLRALANRGCAIRRVRYSRNASSAS